MISWAKWTPRSSCDPSSCRCSFARKIKNLPIGSMDPAPSECLAAESFGHVSRTIVL